MFSQNCKRLMHCRSLLVAITFDFDDQLIMSFLHFELFLFKFRGAGGGGGVDVIFLP
uniref:Uncharacterized protein n=1 Tax=Anguilla anguilla TaxID=7936 RepID=A0A0E9W605_ANGAN